MATPYRQTHLRGSFFETPAMSALSVLALYSSVSLRATVTPRARIWFEARAAGVFPVDPAGRPQPPPSRRAGCFASLARPGRVRRKINRHACAFLVNLVYMFVSGLCSSSSLILCRHWFHPTPPAKPTLHDHVYSRMIFRCSFLWEVMVLCVAPTPISKANPS